MPEPPFYASFGKPFIELKSVDSTNNYALKELHAGLAHHGTAFFAREQLAGKGQRGKTWNAEKDSSLLLSMVINPYPILLSQQFQLSACVAVSVYELFSQYAGDNTRIKWPNDLYWQDRKAGGILIENIVGSRSRENRGWEWVIIGIGININQSRFPDDLKNPVSLKQITGKEYNPIVLAKELCFLLDKNFNTLITKGFKDLYASYLTILYKRNELVKLKKNNRVFEARIKSVSTFGKLIVKHAIEEEFDFGEIEWIIPAAKSKK